MNNSCCKKCGRISENFWKPVKEAKKGCEWGCWKEGREVSLCTSPPIPPIPPQPPSPPSNPNKSDRRERIETADLEDTFSFFYLFIPNHFKTHYSWFEEVKGIKWKVTAQLKPDVEGKTSSIDKPISHDSIGFLFCFCFSWLLEYIFIHGISPPSIHPSLHFTSLHLNLRNSTQPNPLPNHRIRGIKQSPSRVSLSPRAGDLVHSITGEETETETEKKKKKQNTRISSSSLLRGVQNLRCKFLHTANQMRFL